MRSNNNHETITHLAMPERQIPVLIDAGSGRSEGFMPSTARSGELVTRVRRVLPSLVEGLENPQRRKEIEKEHGPINAAQWSRLLELLALIDRLNAGDSSPIVKIDRKALDPLAQALQEMSPGGWFVEGMERGSREIALRSVSGNMRGRISIGHLEPIGAAFPKAPSQARSDKSANLSLSVHAEATTAAFALAEAFTQGLSKTRFVIWWADLPKKLVPGLYCPDIVTALYASVLSTLGTPGGVGVCQRSECGAVFPRTRAKQLYCNHKCQVAAAMKRHRGNLKLKAESASNAPTKTKKRTGRK
jgi:hypothetical protein